MKFSICRNTCKFQNPHGKECWALSELIFQEEIEQDNISNLTFYLFIAEIKQQFQSFTVRILHFIVFTPLMSIPNGQ